MATGSHSDDFLGNSLPLSSAGPHACPGSIPRMTMTTLLIVNAFLALAAIGALAAVVRLPFRGRGVHRAETLHPSQPLPLRLVGGQEGDLSRAA
jgi:hypothetical protein